MKKLKKLTRKGLDELANEMPEMKVAEQSECVGAIRYYWEGGDGSKEQSLLVGTSEEIMITTSNGMMYACEGLDPQPQDILPLSTNGMNMKILYNQALSKVNYQGLGSGVVITQGTSCFNVNVDTNFNDPTLYISLPSDSNGHLYQYEIDAALEGLNDYYESGAILRSQGLI